MPAELKKTWLLIAGNRIELEVGHVQTAASSGTQTGNQVPQSSKEDAETADAGAENNGQQEMRQHPAWLLIGAGLVIAGIGILWLLAPSLPWLGKLPGDIRIERENFRFYFPVTTCIIISLLLTGVAWLVRFLSR